MRRALRITVAAFFFIAVAPPVLADIYGFVDRDGVAHFSDVPLDNRYALYKRDVLRPSIEYPADGTVATQPQPQARRQARARSVPGAPYASMVSSIAGELRVDPALVHAVIAVESAHNPRARSPKGASGLMQLMPDTARRYHVRDIWDPRDNIRGGVRYLSDLLFMFNDNLSLALAAYNAGEGAVMQAGNRIPPYAETRQYVPRVMRQYQRYRDTAAF